MRGAGYFVMSAIAVGTVIWLGKSSLPENVSAAEERAITASVQPAAGTVPAQSVAITETARVADEYTSTEREALLRNVTHLFTQLALTTVDRKELTPQLLALNAMGERAVDAMFAELRALPSADEEMTTRMAVVDYFRYRMRWDDTLRARVVAYVEEDLPAATPNKAKAMILADKAELLGGLATVDRDHAAQIADALPPSLLKNIAFYEIYHGLIQNGDDHDTALAFVKTFDAEFRL